MMLGTVLAALVVLVVAAALRAAARPAALQVRRTTRIEASPEKVWPLIDDFQLWASWAPFEDLDPVMRRTYSEPAAGAGAVYAWKSSGRAGSGRMEIAESSAAKVVVHVRRPHAREVAEFTLRPVCGGTEVTWSLQGSASPLARLFGAQRTLARDFDTGLANLKAAVERSWSGPRKPPRRAPRRPRAVPAPRQAYGAA